MNQKKRRMGATKVSKNVNHVPYNATIVPLPSGVCFASPTEALRSEMNVSTTCNVKRYSTHIDRQHSVATTRPKGKGKSEDGEPGSGKEKE
jgi:hypothetical protein